jgi:acetyl-CoA carboxylase/biotin carboxylase 1
MQLALKASELLEQTKLSELRTSIARNLSALEMFTEERAGFSLQDRKLAINESITDLVTAPLPVEDALVSLFDSSDQTLQQRVIETYISRLYQVLHELFFGFYYTLRAFLEAYTKVPNEIRCCVSSE